MKQLQLSTVVYMIFGLFCLTVIILNIQSVITFGYGLDDKDLLIMLVLKFGLISIYYLFIKAHPNGWKYYGFFLAVLITMAFVILKISIFRSAHYPWNGRVFLI